VDRHLRRELSWIVESADLDYDDVLHQLISVGAPKVCKRKERGFNLGESPRWIF
jgi:hypothetical protein